jgi:dihydroneopterin aldolase
MLEALKSDPKLAEYSPAWSLDQDGMQVFPSALPLRVASIPRNADQAQPTGEAFDLVFINGLVGETIIGIHESELNQPQPLVIDVYAGVPHSLACSTDHIGDTINYGDLRRRLLRLLAEHRVKLVEAFAELVADITLYEFEAQWVRVRVSKPCKYADVQSLGVIIERCRAKDPLPLKAPSPSA